MEGAWGEIVRSNKTRACEPYRGDFGQCKACCHSPVPCSLRLQSPRSCRFCYHCHVRDSPACSEQHKWWADYSEGELLASKQVATSESALKRMVSQQSTNASFFAYIICHVFCKRLDMKDSREGKHPFCPEYKCSVNHLDRDQYQPKHTVQGCDCDSGGCLGSQPGSLTSALQMVAYH